MPTGFPNDQFFEDREEMLLSLDVDVVRRYAAKYGIPAPEDDYMVLISLHKARTAATTLPEEARQLSRDWLAPQGRGYRAMG